MTKVYIPNKGPHDYHDAEQFGELVYCTIGALDKFDTAQMFRELNDSLYDSSAEDFILLTSLTSLCSIACAIFAHQHGRLNLLIHSRDGYTQRTIILT